MAIIVRQDIPNEAAVRIALSKLKKESEEVIRELRKREFYQKPSIKRKLKSLEARKNAAKLARKKEKMRGDR